MNKCETWKGYIYLGLKEGYNGSCRHYKEVFPVIREYTDLVGWAVTVTPTNFVYTGGEEPGVIIGAIQYPRFPKEIKLIESHLYSLAHLLMTTFKQYRCTVEFPDRSYLLENEDLVGNEGDRT